MANVTAAILGVLVLGALYCTWRASTIFLTFTPAAADVKESSYTEELRQRDAPWGYGWYNRGKPGIRFIHDKVQFENDAGDMRTASVSRWVSRRYPPYDSYVVWYDTKSSRATANGPSYWLGFAAVLVAMLGGIVVFDAEIISHHHVTERPLLKSTLSALND